MYTDQTTTSDLNNSTVTPETDNSGVIIALVVSASVAVILLIVMACCCYKCCSKRRQNSRQPTTIETPVEVTRAPSVVNNNSQSVTQETKRPVTARQLSTSVGRNENGEKCTFYNFCKKTLARMDISNVFFEVVQDICFCESCMVQRGDQEFGESGEPSKRYGVPKGWVQFAIRLTPRAASLAVEDKWHVAYHGTHPDNVQAILEHEDLLMPDDMGMRDSIKEAPGHYNAKRKPPGFNTKQVFVSPSMVYAAHPTYAKDKIFIEEATRREIKTQTVFQLRIMPDKYQIGPQTVRKLPTQGFFNRLVFGRKVTPPIDPTFSDAELEWSTSNRRVIQLTGLMFKAEYL